MMLIILAAYHWASLWQALQHLLAHLDANAVTLSKQLHIHTVASFLVQILSLAIISGDSILPDATAYEDFFSQLHLSYSMLPKIRDAYSLPSLSAMNVLLKTSKHCKSVLDEQEKGGKKVTPKDVGRVLRVGFEESQLRIEGLTGEAEQGPFREVEWRALLKKAVRSVVQDAQELVARKK